MSQADFTLPTAPIFHHSTRPNVKIQDGCDFFCSFCIIPYTRGRERSRTFDNILLEASLWAAQGYKEIVLTGVNVGKYSSAGKGLIDLMIALESIEGLDRIRISSIEPTTVPTDLLDRMTKGKVCPYLHLPLQSGSNTVLSNMGRRYTVEEYTRFAWDAIDRVPSLCLGTDVMVGFPGEGEAEFEETVSLLSSLPFAYFHVFPFSERKGTRVTRMGLARVPSSIIKKRARLLIDLSKTKREAFYHQAVGKTAEVLFEYRNAEGFFEGYTANYIRVATATDDDLTGTIRPVCIKSVMNETAFGVIAS